MTIFPARRLAVCIFCFVNFSTIQSASAENISQAPQALSRFVQSNINQHPNLLAAKADVRSSKALQLASDQAVYNPELAFNYEDGEVLTQTVGISQTIDWGDQQGSRSGVASAQYSKAVANYDLQVQSLISELLIAMAQNQTASALAKLSDETLGLMLDFKKNAQRRFQAGDLNQVELNLASLSYSQVIMDQASAQSNAIESSEKLRAILGRLPTDLPELPERLPEPHLEKDMQAYLQNLPLIRYQLADLQVAKQQVELRKSEKAWNPTVEVTAGSEGDADLIGLNLSVPLNIRNTFSAEVDAAQQELLASEQRAQLAYRNTQATLVVTTARYKNLLKAWNSWRENSRTSVDQQLVLIKQLWQAGDISAADYVLQLKQALETRATGLELRNELWQAAFEWMSLTNTIDNWLNINYELAGNK